MLSEGRILATEPLVPSKGGWGTKAKTWCVPALSPDETERQEQAGKDTQTLEKHTHSGTGLS